MLLLVQPTFHTNVKIAVKHARGGVQALSYIGNKTVNKGTEQELSYAFHLALFLKMKLTSALFQTQ